mmetsp:Transcript_117217/g.343323  ORF Transcript_117217/g.343323 Transcript_117217/m.343323 type:complete len:890 (-) Transcript_117217:169-2838(-)
MLAVLRKARPTWTAKDASIAQQKLSKIGVTSVSALADAIEGPLNDRLRAAGLRTFTVETIESLKKQLDADFGVQIPEGTPIASDEVVPKWISEQQAPARSLPRTEALASKAKDETDLADVSGVAPNHETSRADTLSDPHFEVLTGDAESLGMWLFNHNASMYEIRAVADGGLVGIESMEDDIAADDPAAVSDETGLWYIQRFANGIVVYGELKRPADDTAYEWEARLNNGAGLRLRRKGKQMVSRYRPPGKPDWEMERNAERPQGYAFYDSENHAQSYRFVHLGNGEGGGHFPIVGLTAGWLPVALTDVPKPELFHQRRGEVKVRFLGTFCDPFEAASPPPLSSKIRTVAPRAYGGNPAGQVLLTGDGGVTVQPPSRPPPSFGGPLGKGSWRKPGKGGFRPFSFAAKTGKQGAGVFAKTTPLALNPTQTVAAAFGITTSQLRERALFRGKLRQVPHRRSLQGLEVEIPAGQFRTGTSGSPRRPLISILCLRWYDYWSDPNPCSDYNLLNDGFFTDLFHGPRSMGRLLPGEYEVYTIFIRCTEDLQKLNPHHLRAMLKGQSVATWYFVWPSIEGTGFVREPEFFAFCQRMERAPLRSCWPHESSLYRQLCGKLWIPQMSLNKKFRVPPTTRVHYAEFLRDARKAAVRALQSIMRLRRTVWGKSDVSFDSFRGVVKLGFSWCGSDVLPFQGLHSLVTNLRKLFESEGTENNTCLVQEMVPGVVGEHRILCLYDKSTDSFHREALWMENIKESSAQVKHNVSSLDVAEFKAASSINMKPEAVTKQCFEGDRFAMRLAEADAMQLVDRWLRWYRTESPDPPQCTRIDFLVTHAGPGRAEVWTCEVGECGASLCSVEVHGRNLAALNRLILRDAAGRFPQRMPSEMPRNSGMKS